MANLNVEQDTQLSFPLPPTFYFKKYTNENVNNAKVPPPPPLVSGEYSMFGHTQKTDDEIIQPLESQGIKRLYSKSKTFNHIAEMKKLNHSILTNYMELLDIMIEAPASEERHHCIEKIRLLFINLHHLINEFRPHQTRETLRIMLHRQKQQRLETAERLKDNIEKARVILKRCSGGLQSLSSDSGTTPSNVKESQEMTIDEPKEAELITLRELQHKIMCDMIDGIS